MTGTSELKASDFVTSWTGQQLVLVTNSLDPQVCNVVPAADIPCISNIWPGHAIPLGVDVCHLPTIVDATRDVRRLLYDNCARQLYGSLAGALQDLAYIVQYTDITLDVVAGSAETWVHANRKRITPTSTVEDVIDMALNGDLVLLDAGDVADELERLRDTVDEL